MHVDFLQQALDLAQIRRGFCAPNPSVGAVIVRQNEVIGSGYHLSPGQDHAEVSALKSLQDNRELSDASIYITLEPCCHTGRTPPCTDAIISSGIKRVFYGFRDPNPVVDGGGEKVLQEHGIHCKQIPLTQIDQFYRSYAHWTRTAKPWVTGKLAMSMDNIAADVEGNALAITGVEAKQATFEHRQNSDALLTTAQTIVGDNPQLSVRLDDTPRFKPIYILDHDLRTPLDAKVLQQEAQCTIIHAQGVDASQYTAQNIRCVALNSTGGQFALSDVIAHIGQDGVHDLWIEAGPTLFNALLNEQLLDRALLYIAPKCFGEGLSALKPQALSLVSNAHVSWYHYGLDGVCDILFTKNEV